AWKRGNLGEARRLLSDCPAEHRHVEWHYLEQMLDGTQPLKVGDFSGGIRALAFNRAGSAHLAVAGVEAGRAVVRVWDYPTKFERLILADVLDAVHGVALSPSGEHIAVAGSAPDGTGQVRVWKTQEGGQRGELLFSRGFLGQPATAVAYTP